MGRKIVLAVDDSAYSQRAWEFYNEHVHQAEDEVIIVHGTEVNLSSVQRVSLRGSLASTSPVEDSLSAGAVQNIIAKAQEGATSVATTYHKLLEAKQIPHKMVCDFGKPGEIVVKTADDEKATMVVMGTRGQGKVRRTFLGSVSDYVVHHAHCPVVVVRQ